MTTNKMLYYFNPGHETGVLNQSVYYTAPANTVTMQQELGFLPAWYAQPNSTIIVEREDEAYLNYLKKNLNMKIGTTTLKTLSQHKGKDLSIWGLCPQASFLFNELNKEYELNLQIPQWKEEYLERNSRVYSAQCLKDICTTLPYFPESIIPQFFSHLEAVENFVENYTSTEDKQYPLLAKSPYSSSGKGLLRLPAKKLTRTELQILHGMIRKQGKVSVEPLHNKKIDFAMEFMSKDGHATFVGYSLFKTNEKGAYLGNCLQSQESIERILSEKVDLDLLNKVKRELESILTIYYASIYEGCIGVDMLIYEEDGELKLHPCIEINMRYNMGYLSMMLFEQYIHQTSEGTYMVEFSPKVGESYQKHLKLQKGHPALFENNRLIKGYLPLCPIHEDNKYLAFALID